MNAALLLLILAAPPEPTVAVLDDGTELVVVRVPGAPTISFRYLVHAGGGDDPVGRGGLAHFVEHLVFHGANDIDGAQLFQRARQSGAHVNAHTTPDYTVYELDAPRAAAEGLVPLYLKIITSPALGVARLDRERGVVLAEAELRSEKSVLWLVDQVLFPGKQGTTTLVGKRSSLAAISTRDVIDFYATHYQPTNTSIVITGDLELEQAKVWIERASRLAPAPPPRSGAGDERTEANVPVTVDVRAPLFLTVHGYALDDVDRGTCRDLAALLELRLTIAATFRRAIAAGLRVECVPLRGHELLIAVAATSAVEGLELPGLLREHTEALRTSPPSAAERRTIRDRDERRLRSTYLDPRRLAELIVAELALPGPRENHRSALVKRLQPAALDPRSMADAATRSFVDPRRIEIHVKPF